MASKSAKVSTTASVAKTTAPAASSGLERYARPGLPVAQIVQLKECFDIFDYDKSGRVSPHEMEIAIRALGTLSLLYRHCRRHRQDPRSHPGQKPWR